MVFQHLKDIRILHFFSLKVSELLLEAAAMILKIRPFNADVHMYEI